MVTRAVHQPLVGRADREAEGAEELRRGMVPRAPSPMVCREPRRSVVVEVEVPIAITRLLVVARVRAAMAGQESSLFDMRFRLFPNPILQLTRTPARRRQTTSPT